MSAEHEQKHVHHIPLDVYFKIFGGLLVLTAITVAASRVDFGSMNTVIAMLIASVKAALVLGFFMHLKYDDKIYAVMFGSAVFFLVLLYFFSWIDIYTRILQHNIL
jgi:cytochrome c oxidase subunit 4